MKKLRLVVADEHEVVLKGLVYILQQHNEFEVVGEAYTPQEAVEKALELEPDVVILDVRLAGGSGIEACRQIKERNSDIMVMMLSSDCGDEAIFDAIMAGANGFILKGIKSDDLIKTVKAIGEGKSLLDPSITKKVLECVKSNAYSCFKKEDGVLNQQEKRVLALIAEGKTNKEIANILILSDKTIKNYVSNIFSKMNFNNRAEAAAYAVRNNIIFRNKQG